MCVQFTQLLAEFRTRSHKLCSKDYVCHETFWLYHCNSPSLDNQKENGGERSGYGPISEKVQDSPALLIAAFYQHNVQI